MAIVKITPISLDKYNEPSTAVATASFATAINATDGAYYEHKERDDKYVVIAQNGGSASQTLTVKKGNGIQAVVDNTITIAAGNTVAFTLESGAYKFVSGENKGRVMFKGSSADIKLAVIKLP